MEPYFLIVYEGSDRTAKLRLLKENGLSDEIIPSTVSYFKEHTPPIAMGRNTDFHVFHPIGGGDDFDFFSIEGLCTFSTTRNIPAWKLLEETSRIQAGNMYAELLCRTYNNAMCEKSQSSIH